MTAPGDLTPRTATGLPQRPHGTDQPGPDVIDVETLRGRRATNRWERTSIGDVFERITWSRPDRDAIIGAEGAFGEERFASLTYRQADEAANRLAHSLAEAGLAPGDRVMLFGENSVEGILSKIGIAKAGMVTVPVNPNLAPEVLEYIIELTKPGLVIVDAELWPRLAEVAASTGLRVGATITIGGGPVADSPSFGDLLEGKPETEPDVEIHGDDIYQLLFTSGTTAMPKGVMISHSYVHLGGLIFAPSITRGLRHEADLRLCTFLPMIYHVGDTPFTYSTFLMGGTLVLGRRPEPAAVIAAAASTGTTALWAGSPQFVAGLADQIEANPGLDVSALTVLVYGWGALSPALLKRLEARFAPGFVTIGLLGQTEAIACHRFWPSAWPEVHERTAPSVNYVGLPVGLLGADVVDEQGDPVRGEPGEAVYRSPIMTAGYYRNPEATREAFRGGWFHSGDSVTVDENGLRIMIDRYKDIVKSGGENVSSMRVETALCEHPEVLRAAVIGLPHERWGEAVTAIVIPRSEQHPSEEELVAFCRRRLAGYEAPKAVVFAESLPETVGGKVLKYKLRAQHAGLYD